MRIYHVQLVMNLCHCFDIDTIIIISKYVTN